MFFLVQELLEARNYGSQVFCKHSLHFFLPAGMRVRPLLVQAGFRVLVFDLPKPH